MASLDGAGGFFFRRFRYWLLHRSRGFGFEEYGNADVDQVPGALSAKPTHRTATYAALWQDDARNEADLSCLVHAEPLEKPAPRQGAGKLTTKTA